jgi:cysteine desulfurase
VNAPIYLDHHATTPCDPRVVEKMLPFFTEHFGNPASITHAHGRKASIAVEDARFGIARFSEWCRRRFTSPRARRSRTTSR